MLWSGNWVTPTHHGAYYYNKPPLWNWILALSFWLHGEASEWATRLPAVLALLSFGAIIYASAQRELGQARAFLAALFFLTCGRVLLWESLLGLIDIFFSLIIYLLFWVVYHYERKQAWWPLFLASYGLMVVGYMLKGLPAIAFQGITLVLWLTYRGHWQELFRIPHLLSGLLSVVLIGSYYWLYSRHHDLSPLFAALFTESSKRTAAAYGFSDTLRHFLSFPVALFYHFLPWSFLGLSLVHPKARQRVWSHPFSRYALLVGLANVIIYWLSPNFYPRYILMLIPLFFIVLLQAYHHDLPSWIRRSY
ncbi:MAG: glycosyl transferase, partial [Bacteroidetes bacterium]